MKRLQREWIDLIHREVGCPDYAFTITLDPRNALGRTESKVANAEQAMDWFLHVLNVRCFGHGHRRRGLEVGFFAVLEGLSGGEQPHWHGVIRLPGCLSHDKFQKAFITALSLTKRLGIEFDLQPYFDCCWEEYITKGGVDSINPKFLRKGSP